MGKNRLEAFSDGVLAIIITIMVLELKVPRGDDLDALRPLLPVFFTYVLSFMYVGIYWVNHHHLLHTLHRVNGAVLWANLHLLFWLSLFPFVTGWMGENHATAIPTALYGVVLFMAAISYYILQGRIVAAEGKESVLASALGKDVKGRLSVVLYAVSIPVAFTAPLIANSVYLVVALIWFIPDRRIERILASAGRGGADTL